MKKYSNYMKALLVAVAITGGTAIVSAHDTVTTNDCYYDSATATNSQNMTANMSSMMGGMVNNMMNNQSSANNSSMHSMMNGQNSMDSNSMHSMMSGMMNGGMMGMTATNSMNGMMGMMGHMHGVDDVPALKQVQQAAKPLAIPPMQKGTVDENGVRHLEVTAQEGKTAIKDGALTDTYGYNGSVLGTTLYMKHGEKVAIKLKNELPEKTTYHWHGMVVRSDVDGGPHYPIAANGGTGEVEFTVDQSANTAWYHPHAMGLTASQVYKGLAGFIYVDDNKEGALNLPHTYGVDDIPVAIQERNFTADNQWDYEKDYNADGVYGDTLVVNGTINPYFDVKTNMVRLRLLNGSNARTYTLQLSDMSPMMQVAGDGGILPWPVPKQSITIAPGERVEVLVDFSKYKDALPSLVTTNGTNGTANVLNFKRGADTLTAEAKVNTDMAAWNYNNMNASDDLTKPADKSIVMSGMAQNVMINGKKFDMGRIDFTSKLGSTEIWDVSNADPGMMGMMHPFHVHGVQFEVLSRNGRPVDAAEKGLKDTIQVDPGEHVRIRLHFTKPGVFMVHCHILEHEENGMMLQLEVK